MTALVVSPSYRRLNENRYFDEGEGQLLVLLGVDGSGKTATPAAIARLAAVDKDETRTNTAKNGRIGICPQNNVF
ncbi:hypothetical protein B9Z19DRAFT_1122928 [Tuber borchii]|uniref:Uncharacterized protein n=1 Tax=Tuber borchii TaxID=42251 RepID=A0A2T6ZZD5_TUBBO|nr:hypothetical protein B9Z19DRAFT_1122928 [Tuber borchii]